MTLVEKLERAVRWSRAHRGDADARAYGEDGEPVCVVCGGRIVRTHGGPLPKTCADCHEVYRAGWELSRRGVEGDSLVVAIERTAARMAKTSKKGRTPYSVRRKRIEAAGSERVTTWRGMPCMGGGFAQNTASSLAPAWDAPTVPLSAVSKKKRKGGAK